jgi:hypothetical protein
MTAWVTAEQATEICGREVTLDQIAQAAPIIEIYTGVTTDAADSLKPRDRRLLRYATAYQAAWMPAQVDILTRMDVDNVDQDGVEYSKADADAHLLAPLAKQSVKRLSWMKTRAILPLTPEQAARLRGVYLNATGTEEWLDDHQAWEPL